jgi:hypothetical protein
MREASTGRGLRGRLLAPVALTGPALTAATGAAGPAAAGPADGAASALPFDAGGTWTDVGLRRWPMTVVGNTVFVDMSHDRRPDATGTVLDASRILVTFPDDDTHLGTFVTPTYIRWSNGSAWQKVFTGPQAFVVEGNWADQSDRHVRIGMFFGIFQLDLPGPGPHGAAFATSATTIRATFPGNVTVTGTLRAPNHIDWSNGVRWRFLGPYTESPGPPSCLRPVSILC